MLDVGWTELVVIAIVLIIVVGPKDLPPMLRTFGKMMSKMRGMATDFRHQFDEALREADLDDVRKTLSDAQKLNPANSLREAMNPLRQMGNDIKADLQKATRPDEKPAAVASDIPPAPEMAASVAIPAEQPAVVTNGVTPAAGATDTVASAPVTPVTSSPLATDTRVETKPRKRSVKAEAGNAEAGAVNGVAVALPRKKSAKAPGDTTTAKPRKRASAPIGDADVAEIGAKLAKRKKTVKADVPLNTPMTPKSGDDA
ncbi:Sec-independent protein translocase protein TatB [Ferranicluibacter rubi]|uniref:Sec-independent protein translocase protein TatB n=1 Tax=Ferranicluibacter rubi TaxID=2715133 RepID=UPI00248ADCFD|nr:Sec-independent protein translocase protein TatB [Ferranicluibacter rubi]